MEKDKELRQLNINSLRNKFDLLTYQIKDTIDILMITETKLDESFPIGQFFINSFSIPFRLDSDRNGGGILLYIREDITWLIRCSYNPNQALIANHMAVLSKSIDVYTTKYDNYFWVILIRD